MAGIVEVINYEATLEDSTDDVAGVGPDGMDNDQRMLYLIRRGRAMGKDYSVLAECAIKGVKNPKTGETGYINAYSGIVFKTDIHRSIFTLKNKESFDTKALPIWN